ncbi:hypothetical protein M011DRAFT_127826 [Sporormia fimetaria CBS 119925]|uniref:Uncharacterized protein n=1 Tax=Sporormia fimetaria CBS 119925 TaxID=1340428 RepID=A0A6A6V5U8_9PLEO|nr:hypothetical protein M011DRAFT_127826 [Sporormia fimetaria CBS 119925]
MKKRWEDRGSYIVCIVRGVVHSPPRSNYRAAIFISGRLQGVLSVGRCRVETPGAAWMRRGRLLWILCLASLCSPLCSQSPFGRCQHRTAVRWKGHHTCNCNIISGPPPDIATTASASSSCLTCISEHGQFRNITNSHIG